MGIVERTLNSLGYEKRSVHVGPTDSLGLPYGFGTGPVSTSLAMQLSATYRCVEVISDAIATQLWDLRNYTDEKGWSSDPFNPITYLLNTEPGPSISRYTLMKTVISKVLLEGNGYIIIRRDPYMNPVRLDLVTSNVQMFRRSDQSVYYDVSYAGYEVDLYGRENERVEGADMIHILNYSYDGLQGVSTLYHAANTMGLAYASESTAKGFFL